MSERGKIVQLKVKVPKYLLQGLDFLVKAGIFPNRNEAIREAIRIKLS